jgi:hypothetical protein
MKYLSLLVHDEIVSQIPAGQIADEQAMALDAMLRKWGCLDEETEVAITEDIHEANL